MTAAAAPAASASKARCARSACAMKSARLPGLRHPGCDGCPCEECVFAMDPYCAETAWDSYCVDECVNACGGCAVVLPNCGNGTCDAAEGENCKFCEDDCACGEGESCTAAGECCMPNCEGKPCGDDGCGGPVRPLRRRPCCVDGACVPTQGPTECLGPRSPAPWTAWASPTSVAATPPAASSTAWTGSLLHRLRRPQPVLRLDAAYNYYDCGTDGSGDPANVFPLECALETTECTPKCDGKTCGDDGCKGNCGICNPDKECIDGVCTACEPQCAGRTAATTAAAAPAASAKATTPARMASARLRATRSPTATARTAATTAAAAPAAIALPALLHGRQVHPGLRPSGQLRSQRVRGRRLRRNLRRMR